MSVTSAPRILPLREELVVSKMDINRLSETSTAMDSTLRSESSLSDFDSVFRSPFASSPRYTYGDAGPGRVDSPISRPVKAHICCDCGCGSLRADEQPWVKFLADLHAADLSLAQSIAGRIRERSYTLRQYHDDVVAAFPELHCLSASDQSGKRRRGSVNSDRAAHKCSTQHKCCTCAACCTCCLLYTSPSPRDLSTSRMPSSA